MEAIPLEILELILASCESKTLAISVPRVSKLFKKISEDNGNVWRAKYEATFSGSNSKSSDDQSWKQFYFNGCRLQLFPLFGFTIRKSTHEEIKAQPTAVSNQSGPVHYVKYQDTDFWIANGVFDGLYIIYSRPLPVEWIAQGLTFELSWNEAKDLLKRKVGNYQVTEEPNYKQFHGTDCFTATITSVLKHGEGADAIYYQLILDYKYSPGTESSNNLMYKLEVWSKMSMDLSTIYQRRECNDKIND